MPTRSKFYEAIANNISEGVYVVGMDGTLLFINDFLAKMFGYTSAKRLVGKNLYRDVFPDQTNADLFYRYNSQLFCNLPERISWGQPGIRTDGNSLWIEVKARRIEVGGETFVFGTILDQTDCKLLNDAMYASQESFRQLFDAMDDRVYVVTEDFKIIYANRKMRDGLVGDVNNECCYKVCRGLDTICEDCTKDKVFASDVPLHKEIYNQQVGKWFSVIELAIQIPGFKNRKAKLAVARDITFRKEAEDRIRALSRQLISAHEEERSRLSRELHDDLGQQLNAAKLGLERLMQDGGVSTCKLAPQAAEICTILDSSINCIREITRGLRPDELERLGLVKTMKEHCQRIASLHHIPVDFKAAGMQKLQLEFHIAINLFRILQEALNNVVKHACATSVTVRLLSSHPKIILKVEDNGQGFIVDTPKGVRTGFGIASMAERVDLLGGSFVIQSRPGGGTRIIVEISSTLDPRKKENGKPLAPASCLLDRREGF